MKHENVIKKLSKLAKVQQFEKNGFVARNATRQIRWYKQGEDAICLRVCGINEKDDFQSDYCAGCFYDTIKHAIKAFKGE